MLTNATCGVNVQQCLIADVTGTTMATSEPPFIPIKTYLELFIGPRWNFLKNYVSFWQVIFTMFTFTFFIHLNFFKNSFSFWQVIFTMFTFTFFTHLHFSFHSFNFFKKIFFILAGDFHDVYVCILPFNHVYGLVAQMLTAFETAAQLVTLPRFQVDTFFRAIDNHKVGPLII